MLGQYVGARAIDDIRWMENDGRKDQCDGKEESGVNGEISAFRVGVR